MNHLHLCLSVYTCLQRACLGAGVDMVCAADIRYCTEDSVFAIKEVKLGLAADVGERDRTTQSACPAHLRLLLVRSLGDLGFISGTLQRMPKVMGSESQLRELALTGRDFDATEAAHFGFVSRVFPVSQTAGQC